MNLQVLINLTNSVIKKRTHTSFRRNFGIFFLSMDETEDETEEKDKEKTVSYVKLANIAEVLMQEDVQTWKDTHLN